MERGDGGRTPLVVTVKDSSDTRLFIELSSYGSDQPRLTMHWTWRFKASRKVPPSLMPART